MLESASIGAFLNVTDGDIDRLRAELGTLRELNLDHVEVWLEHQPTVRELDELARLLRGWVAIMHGPFIGMSLATDWDDLAGISLERCHRAIEAAGVLGCAVVTLHAGAYAAFTPSELALTLLSARVARFARIGRPTVTIENMPSRGGATREAVATSADLDRLTTMLPELALTLDVGHSLQNGENPATVARRHAGRIANVHLHDGVAGGRAHTALGTGELAIAELVTALHDDRYAGFISVETLSLEDLTRSLDVLADLDVMPGRAGRRLAGGMPQAA
jgi:sugar phosphate isomerase/epimerase